ncbi:MAG: transcriptional regulator [Acidimicrobiia bacterium]
MGRKPTDQAAGRRSASARRAPAGSVAAATATAAAIAAVPAGEDADGRDAAVLHALAQLVPALSRLLGSDTEVVLHDVRKLPNSIVAIDGDVTGRRPGDPMTDYLLRQLRNGNLRDVYHYRTELPDGHEGNSTTFGVKSQSGELIAVLCVNRDLTAWRTAAELLNEVVSTYTGEAEPPQEFFPRSVNELVATSIDKAVAQAGVPVELMKKRHKVAVVGQLDAQGIFLIRESVDAVAAALQVTRYTIYNYLNQLNGQPSRDSARTRRG